MNRFIQFLLTASALLTGSISGSGTEMQVENIQDQKEQLRLKVTADFPENSREDAGKTVRNSSPIVHYTVPPLSNNKRTALFYPEDGIPDGTLQGVAARGEFIPLSLVLYSFEDIESVQIKISDLSGKTASIPSDRIDAAVVKIWVQSGCAWYSYFADAGGRTLIPELLLHDEKMVKVDTDAMENYVRNTLPGDQSEYLWISAPSDYYPPVWGHRENILDAEKIQPFELKKGEFKQIWFTVHVPEDMPEGIYKGTVSLESAGNQMRNIDISIRTLPFKLPAPKTNYDLSKDFYTTSYCNNNLYRYVCENGGDLEKAKNRLLAEYQGYRDHNLMNPQLAGILPEESKNNWSEFHTYFKGNALDLYEQQMQLFKKAGLDTSVLFDPVLGTADYKKLPPPGSPEAELELKKRIGEWEKLLDDTLIRVRKVFGEDAVLYSFGWDEPDMPSLRLQREAWKNLQKAGIKTYSTGNDSHLLHAGFNEDFINYGGQYDAGTARIWHSIGTRIHTYAKPHTGPENPDFCRRNHGMDLYLADFDGTNNYMVCGNDWNDFLWAPVNYRGFNWVYPASNGFITTLQFEGFRAGIDDIKYATLLRMTANRAIEKGNLDQQYQAKAALQWLIQVDSKNCDLNTLRLEMIQKILALREFLPEL